MVAAKMGIVAPRSDTAKGVVHLSPRRKSVWFAEMPSTDRPMSLR
jgi:hypothetical protein